MPASSARSAPQQARAARRRGRPQARGRRRRGGRAIRCALRLARLRDRPGAAPARPAARRGHRRRPPAPATPRPAPSIRCSGSGRGPRRRSGAVMRGAHGGGAAEAASPARCGRRAARRPRASRPRRAPPRPSGRGPGLGGLAVGGQPGDLALPQRDPVLGQLLQLGVVRPRARSSSTSPPSRAAAMRGAARAAARLCSNFLHRDVSHRSAAHDSIRPRRRHGRAEGDTMAQDTTHPPADAAEAPASPPSS